MNKIKAFVVVAFAAVVAVFASAAEIAYSSGDLVLGQWNTSFANGLKYANDNHVPMIVFYAKSDCSECKKLKSALGESDFLKWQAQTKYVLVFALKSSSSDWSDAREFINKTLDSDDMPKIGVYWNKADGTVIRRSFVGRNSSKQMPYKTGKTLQAKFISAVESILGSSGTGGGETPAVVENPIPEYFTSARTASNVAVYDAGDRFCGIAEVKTGKANTKTKISSVKVSVTLLGGSKKSFSAKVDVANNEAITLTSRYGQVDLTFSMAEGVTGGMTLDGASYSLAQASIGGNFPTETAYFFLDEVISSYGSYEVFSQWLPLDGLLFQSGSRWTLPKKGTVKYDSKAAAFVNSNPENACSLSLSYKAKTGYFSGSFYVNYKTAEKKAKKVKATVKGYVVDGVGIGTAVISKSGTYPVTIRSDLDD